MNEQATVLVFEAVIDTQINDYVVIPIGQFLLLKHLVDENDAGFSVNTHGIVEALVAPMVASTFVQQLSRVVSLFLSGYHFLSPNLFSTAGQLAVASGVR